jgi:hypothetical protein
MSFHGGFIGVMLAAWWFGKRNGKSFFQLMDFVAPLVPIGLGAGRIGNFINAELWGKPTDVPWAMIFPPFSDPAQLPRHPSQLYQFALEGVALFLILWLFSRKPRPTMAVSGMFALFYGIFRFIVEFVRVPDAQLGYLAFGWLTMGQVPVRADDRRRAGPDLAGRTTARNRSRTPRFKFERRGLRGLGFNDTGNHEAISRTTERRRHQWPDQRRPHRHRHQGCVRPSVSA